MAYLLISLCFWFVQEKWFYDSNDFKSESDSLR